MRLLVSVGSAVEAASALEGGADIVDAKDPRTGAIGAVSLEVFRAIHAVAAASRPVAAAIGDASDETTVEQLSSAYAKAGAAFVKVGFAGIASHARVAALVGAACRGADAGGRGRSAVIVVAYADGASSVAREPLVEIATRSGARGVLLDTADKHAPGLRRLIDQRSLAAWVTQAHDNGLLVALAGKLTEADVPFVRDAGADVAGVRGAACDGGRMGRVSPDRVRRLRACCQDAASGCSANRSASV